MLDKIFEMQHELGNKVFALNGINGGYYYKEGIVRLTLAEIVFAARNNKLGPNDLPNVWLNKYLQALEAEIAELKQSLLWKWWSKDKIDIQNVRVELIDMFFFLLSMMICAGLDHSNVYDLYRMKWEVNMKRQENNYSTETKTEDDNKGINI